MSFLASIFGLKKTYKLTSPFEPKPELKSIIGVRRYLSKLSKLSSSDLCVEFSNVMSAKHNIMMQPPGLNAYNSKQKIVTDLTDKATAICIFLFGKPAVFGFAGGDLRSLNELINTIDNEVAQLDLNPEEHGSLLINRLREYL